MGLIVLTNDDGYQSIGLEILAQAIKTLGHDVLVVAPETNQSGKSHSISLSPLHVKNFNQHQYRGWWVVSGTPVDCVRLALSEYGPQQPVCVVSGINRGWNFGYHVQTSGTVAGAREASLRNVPGIALSAPENASWEKILAMTVLHLNTWMSYAVAHPGIYLNINFPESGREWHWAQPKPRSPQIHVHHVEHTAWGDKVSFHYDEHNVLAAKDPQDFTTDVAMVSAGIISVSALPAVSMEVVSPHLEKSPAHRKANGTKPDPHSVAIPDTP
ncbi:MAG: 5'/3'-nucleotidase SurE [Firmicutes bacterium]|uniref:5'-nucleotidase n=1 Tax=Sulfobacillus benefaciens TaxID=453960 RepID=A0A2T2X9I1_9FIRM|nr:5'/3'-nucleotidase SurE [Bacillota bacterium]MCL5013146.1 5'/3'-nucleotidase SurE [Bacillota bacterium]PSR31139.1 MAG: 5'/3'-nucleotidase SurE [Sulfobacillus benefaciens]